MVVKDSAAPWSDTALYVLVSTMGTKELKAALLAKSCHQRHASLFLQDSDGCFTD